MVDLEGRTLSSKTRISLSLQYLSRTTDSRREQAHRSEKQKPFFLCSHRSSSVEDQKQNKIQSASESVGISERDYNG